MSTRTYESEKGSTVTVSGKHGGIIAIDWDWFEEGACCDSHPHFDESDPGRPAIIADCECCATFVVPLRQVSALPAPPEPGAEGSET